MNNNELVSDNERRLRMGIRVIAAQYGRYRKLYDNTRRILGMMPSWTDLEKGEMADAIKREDLEALKIWLEVKVIELMKYNRGK